MENHDSCVRCDYRRSSWCPRGTITCTTKLLGSDKRYGFVRSFSRNLLDQHTTLWPDENSDKQLIVVQVNVSVRVEVRASRYIALWDGDSKALRTSLERIANTARTVIDDVEAVRSRKAVA